MKIPTFISDRRPSTERLFADLRAAVLSGEFPPGGRLPTVRELTKRYSVSHVTAWKALRRMCQEGLAVSQSSNGCIVLPCHGKCWRGQVLMVERDVSGSFYASVLAECIDRTLSESGYLLRREILHRNEKGVYDLSRLDLISGDHFSLVLQVNDAPEITRRLMQFASPLVVLGRRTNRSGKIAAVVRSNHITSAKEFSRICVERGASKVWQIGGWPHPEELSVLKEAGIAAREIVFPPEPDVAEMESVQRMAMEGMDRLLESGVKLPHVIRFTDDFTAMGALQSMLAHGIRIPEDVGVVTLSNRGFGPVFRKRLTREEMDPFAHGKTLAGFLIEYMRSPDAATPPVLSSRYIEGETFP